MNCQGTLRTPVHGESTVRELLPHCALIHIYRIRAISTPARACPQRLFTYLTHAVQKCQKKGAFPALWWGRVYGRFWQSCITTNWHVFFGGGNGLWRGPSAANHGGRSFSPEARSPPARALRGCFADPCKPAQVQRVWQCERRPCDVFLSLNVSPSALCSGLASGQRGCLL